MPSSPLVMGLGEKIMNDWRVDEEWEKECGWYYKNIKLLKIIFPDFWRRAYESKNNFYQYILEYGKEYVERFGEYEEYLLSDRVREFWHTHCMFCLKEIATDMNEECYCSEDGSDWICSECFNDFQENFNWTATEIQDVPTEGFGD